MTSVLKLLRERGGRLAASRLRAIVQPMRRDGHAVMLHNGRSGSTLLGDMLDQNPAIFWDGETIEKRLHQRSEREDVGIDKLYGKLDVETELAAIRQRMSSRCGNRIFGTELQDYHLDMLGASLPDMIEQLRRVGFTKFILLERNYLRKIVSHLVATQKRRHHVSAETKVTVDPIRINPDRIYIGHTFTTLQNVLEQYRSFAEAARANVNGGDLLELSYESDIETDPNVACARVCDFLGVETHQAAIKFGKTTNVPLNEVVENYSEVASALDKSGFGSLLDSAG